MRKKKIYISKRHHTSDTDRKQQKMMYMRKYRLRNYLNSPHLHVRVQADVELYVAYGGDPNDLDGIIKFIIAQETYRDRE